MDVQEITETRGIHSSSGDTAGSKRDDTSYDDKYDNKNDNDNDNESNMDNKNDNDNDNESNRDNNVEKSDYNTGFASSVWGPAGHVTASHDNVINYKDDNDDVLSKMLPSKEVDFASRKRKATTSATEDDRSDYDKENDEHSDGDSCVATIVYGSDSEGYMAVATPIVKLERPMFTPSRDSKKTNNLGKMKGKWKSAHHGYEIGFANEDCDPSYHLGSKKETHPPPREKSNRTSPRNKNAMIDDEDATKSNRTSTMNKDAMNDGEIPMEDPTPYIDKYLVKIRHELDTRKRGKSQQKAVSKEKIDDYIKRKQIKVAATAKDDNLNEKPHYSVHRFIISNTGTIGIKIVTLTKSKRIIMGTVFPDSIASQHGIEVDDEILWPCCTSGPVNEPTVIHDLFIAATQKRQIAATKKRQSLMLEIQRTYIDGMHKTIMLDDKLHCLHRFIITEKGDLGIELECHNSMTRLRAVAKNSLGEYYGMKMKDVICREGVLVVPDEIDRCFEEINSGERPMVIEVWRATRRESTKTMTSINIQSDRENPFLIEFPKIRPEPKMIEIRKEVQGIGKNVKKNELANNDEVEIETGNTGETRRGKKVKLDSSEDLVMGDGDDDRETGGGNNGDNGLVQVTIMVKGTSAKRERRIARVEDLFNEARSNITFVKDRITYSCGPPKNV